MRNWGIRAMGLALVMALLLGIAPVSMAAVQPLVFQETNYTVMIGFKTTVALAIPTTGTIPDDTYFAIKKADQKYATVDPATGVITPKRAGKIYVYAVSKTLGSKGNGRCKLQISNNYSTWKAQKNTSYRAYASPKRLYYLDGQYVGEMYVWNNYFRNGLTELRATSGKMTWVMIDTQGAGGGTIVGMADLGTRYKFKSRVGKNKLGVVKAKFASGPNTIPDLTTGRYTLAWLGWDDYVTIVGYKGITLDKSIKVR